LDLIQEPGIDPCRIMEALDRDASAQCSFDQEDPLGRWCRASAHQVIGLEPFEGQLRRITVEAEPTRLQAAQRFLERLGEGTADRHDLAD
jgi:hypothetical protein